MAKTKKTTTDLAEFIRAKLAKNTELAEGVEEARIAADIAEEIYAARTEAKLTQKELAERIGTQQSVIARLEDSDYTGHTVSMLRRIAAATGKQLGVGFYAKPVVDISCAEARFSPSWKQQEWKIAIEVSGISEEKTVSNDAR